MADISIPPLGTKGRYYLNPPFEIHVQPNEIYELAAERYFDDIEKFGTNVFKTFYEPLGLTEQDVATDRQNRVAILTLLNPKYPPIYVPSSYVKRYPDQNIRPYSQYILTFSLGALPDDVILDTAADGAANAISDYLGVRPIKINIGSMPLTDVITPEEHETREANRQGAIATRETPWAQLVQANAKIQTQEQQIQILTQMVKDLGGLP